MDPNDVKTKLRSRVQARKSVLYAGMIAATHTFEGNIFVNTFNINQTMGIRELANVISGKILPDDEGTVVHLTIRKKPFIYFLMFCWLAFLALFGIPLMLISNDSGFVIMVVFIILNAIVLLRFNIQYKMAQSILIKLWEGTLTK